MESRSPGRAPRPALPFVATLAALALAFAAPDAHAVDVQSEAAVQSSKSLGDYLADLGGDSDPDRLFAARVLRGELKRALKTEARAQPGSITQLDAQALLLELEERLPRACASAVRFKNTVSECADIYALLEDTSALPTLREVLAKETRKGQRKHLEAAIATLEALGTPPAPTLPPPPAPTLPATEPPAPLPAPGPPPTTNVPPTPPSPTP